MLHLTHRDVFLGFFKGKKELIFKLRGGMELNVRGACLYAEIDGRTECVAKFSKAFCERLDRLGEKGYYPYRAGVRFVVAWRDENGEELAVLLPDIYFKRDRPV